MEAALRIQRATRRRRDRVVALRIDLCDQRSVAESPRWRPCRSGRRVLLGDLVQRGFVRVQATIASSSTDERISHRKGPSVDFALLARRAKPSTKIVIAGGFGVGKTTLVGSVSEIVPLRTEALVTNESEGVDDLAAVPTKATTTVAMDFGRLTLAEDQVRYLIGTPGHPRIRFKWDDRCRGAIGAIVLVDTARLDESFSPLDYFESKGLPFIVAVNHFDGTQEYELDEVAAALALPPEVPIIRVDARDRASAKQALVRVTEYALLRLTQSLTVNAN
jgi:signal recognition particle receptor subunit beta